MPHYRTETVRDESRNILVSTVPSTKGRLLGTINHEAETDKFGNKVSIIRLFQGRTFRMVHYPSKSRYRKFFTIYGGRGRYLKVMQYTPDIDTRATRIECGGYAVEWGDGDNLGVEAMAGNGNIIPALMEELQEVVEDDFEQVILTVVRSVQDIEACWIVKERTESVPA